MVSFQLVLKVLSCDVFWYFLYILYKFMANSAYIAAYFSVSSVSFLHPYRFYRWPPGVLILYHSLIILSNVWNWHLIDIIDSINFIQGIVKNWYYIILYIRVHITYTVWRGVCCRKRWVTRYRSPVIKH